MTFTKRQKEQRREEARIKLLGDFGLKPGDVIHTVLRHVSSSGMSRSIDVLKMKDGEFLTLTYWVVRLLDLSFDERHDGVKVGGCGMDMGFALVYDMGRVLFPDGFGDEGELPLGHKIRPKTKEQAARAVAKGAKFRGRNGDPSGWDNDGGYALRQRWI